MNRNMIRAVASPLAWSLVGCALLFSTAQVAQTLWLRHVAEAHSAGAALDAARSAYISKIRSEGGRDYLWASGHREQDLSAAEWFDMTGAPIPLSKINHGIGRDKIPAIDAPFFVKPDDVRLKASWNRWDERELDRLDVIGFMHGGEARAYPIALLNHHELVNDTVGGKPVTIGW